MVDGFPYSVYFYIEGDTVTVFAVAHNSRDRDAWMKRL